jgi:drug/metabolite transporter (DMT)-like permease
LRHTIRIAGLTALAMLAFAANSVLCRLALLQTDIDPASFTALRLASGAAVLWALARWRGSVRSDAGNWLSALALFVYAAGFSFAYVSLPTGTGALLLFGAVQLSMIGVGLWRGERLGALQGLGLALALTGLVVMLLPGLTAPEPAGAALMLIAGAAWGVYSLRGRGAGDAIGVNAGNFVRTLPLALGLLLWLGARSLPDPVGVSYALASGALASGLGYAIWYAALPSLRATTAASVQLSVPVIAAIAGVVLLAEPLELRLVLSALAVLGGVALVIRSRTV